MLLEEPEVLPEFLRCAPEFTNCEVQSELRSLLWKEIGSISPEHEKGPIICVHLCPLPGEGHYFLSPAMVPPTLSHSASPSTCSSVLTLSSN